MATSATGDAGTSSNQVPRRRIGNVVAGLMIGIAGLMDGLQFLINFIPILGQLISLFISFFLLAGFGIWFLLLGVNYFSGRKAGIKIVASLGSVIGEIVPLVSALPILTAGVIGVIIASRLEDAAERSASVKQSRNLPRIGTTKVGRSRALRGAPRVASAPAPQAQSIDRNAPANDEEARQESPERSQRQSWSPLPPLRFGTSKVTPPDAANENAQQARREAA